MKRYAAAFLVAFALTVGIGKAIAGAFPDGPKGPKIAIYVESTSGVSVENVEKALPTLQDYLNRVCEAWHCAGSLYVTSTLPAPTSPDWVIHLVDSAPCVSCWGYHDRVGNTPIAYVSTLDLRKVTWTGILTHELAEMLVDPNVSLWAGREEPNQNPYSLYRAITMYALEVCDPVQGGYFKLGNYSVADFVYRSWFTKGAKGPYDYMRKVSSPFQLGPAQGWAIIYQNGQESTIGYGDQAALWEKE